MNMTLHKSFVLSLFLPLTLSVLGCDRIKALTSSDSSPSASISATSSSSDPHTLARAQLDSQNFGNALQLAEQGLVKDGRDVDFQLIKLIALTQMQRLDSAIPAFEELLRAGFKDTSLIDKDSRLDPLHHDKRYEELLARYGLVSAVGSVAAGKAEVKLQDDGSGEVRAGDVSIKIPKD